MKRKLSLGLALILAGNLLLGTAAPAGSPILSTVHAAADFNVYTTPADGDKNISTNASLSLSFDQLVTPQTGNITVYAEGVATPFVTIPVGNLGLVSSSKSFEIKLGANKPMDPNKKYTVSIPRGLFEDSSGNDSAAKSWAFTTTPVANSAIVASNFSPATNSRVDASTFSQLSFKLNSKLQKGGGSIKLISYSDNSVIQEFKVQDSSPYVAVTTDSVSTTVTLTLASRLAVGSSYYILIDNYAFKDDDNKTFAGIQSGNVWRFFTKGGAVASAAVSPLRGAVNVPVTSKVDLTFDRPMMPASGLITLTQGGATSTVRSFDVNSTSVTGGGSQTISINTASSAYPLSAGTLYTVYIPQGAFYDQDGNPYPAASAGETWSFTTAAQVNSGYTAAFSPADRAENVALNQKIKLTFYRETARNPAITTGATLYKSNGTLVPSTLTQNSDYEFEIVPSSSLDNDTVYYIDIPSGAFYEKNNSASLYGGVNGKTAWSFRTVADDRTAPVLQTAQMENNRTIRLKYDETLNSSIALMLSSFTVTVNDERRNVSGVYITGDSVYVTLETGIAVGQVVKISYSSVLRSIQDDSGNAASAFSLKQVGNGVQSALPLPKDGYLSGKTLVLNFNDSIKAVSAYAYSQFTVYADGSSLGVSSITSSGSSVILGLSNTASSGQTVKLAYYAGSYPLQDQYGQNIANFSDLYIRNSSDVTAPLFQSASGSGNKVLLNYNEGLSSSSLPMNSQFSVLAAGTPNYVTNVSVSGNQVTLTLQSSLKTNVATTVSYVPGSLGISDLNGNRAAYINLQNVSVTGSTNTGIAEISSATVSGDELTVNFSKTMSASSALYSGQFAVRADSSMVGVQTFSLSGSTLKLTLSSIIKTGQAVDLSYMSGGGSIYDSTGKSLDSFTALAVQNLTGTSTTTASRPAYMATLAAAEFGKEYPLLKSDSATAVDDRSTYGQSVKRYNLTAERISASYDYLAKLSTPSLAFEVPSTESAAYVTVPLKPLLDAVNRNSKSTFSVRYGDNLYTLALNDINMNSLAASLAADSSSISLVMRMEKVPSGTFSPLEQKLKLQGMTGITDLVDLKVAASLTSNFNNAAALSVSGDYTARTTASVNQDTASAARLDMSYYDAAYLPTKVTMTGTYTAIRGKVTGNQVVGTFQSTRGFTDMSRHWAKDTVSELTAKNIIDSSYGTTFKPDQKITRAEFAVMLSRGLGLLGDRTTAQRFSDIQYSTQTGDYVGAAAKAGIITGNTDGTFKPGSNITREQLAIMIIRAMEYTGNPITLRSTSALTLSAFKDSKKIQSQSAEFVAKAVQEGIILGMTSTEFQPQGNATRAQAAVMLQRMLEMAGYL